MLKFLREPYPLQQSTAVKLFQLFGLPFCIFCILAFIRPFDLDTAEDSVIYLLAFEYALCTFIPLLFNLFVIAGRFEEKSWTLGKEILFILWNFTVIGAANFALTYYKGLAGLDFNSVVYSFFATVSVGFVPVMLYVVVNQYRLMQHYRKASLAVTGRLEHREAVAETEPNEKDQLIFEAENPAQNFTIDPDTLLFIAAADNYIEIFKMEKGKLSKTLLRSSLKKAEEFLARDKRFLRVHRGYLVNLSRIASVSGNAQGYQLHFEGTEMTVPVSRKLNGVIEGLR